jgi:hypothetical protein
MGKFLKTRCWQWILLLVSLSLFLSIAAYAQDDSQIKDALRMERPPLKYKLIALTPTFCVGVPLKLRLEISNVGQETIKLNRAYFWASSFLFPAAQSGNKNEGELFFDYWPRTEDDDIIFLPPGRTYIAHTYWPFYGEDANFGAGDYTLELIHYGFHKVRFKIRDCELKELKEE